MQQCSRRETQKTYPKLHDDILQSRLSLLLSTQAIHGVDILLENHLVPLPLQRSHSDVNVDLLFREKTLFDVGLDSSEEEGSENSVQLLDDRVGRFLLGFGGWLLFGSFDRGRGLTFEPSVEIGDV